MKIRDRQFALSRAAMGRIRGADVAIVPVNGRAEAGVTQ